MTCILASVSCVLRRQASADALQDLGQSISDFLGPDPYLSLSEACAFHSLLNWIWRNCWASNGHLGRDFKCRSVEVLLEAATSFETRPTLPKDWKGPGNVVYWGGRCIAFAMRGNNFVAAKWIYAHSPHTYSDEDIC
ncbi:hypothetical protein Pcac1_g16891 [Phytophthora cactorum]|uniref:Uncharacterized protein n=1 Tax=Phytophthora cactorum TaxID=29920 RepID=A0A8T0ZUN5_9STRA|nr:hypothetical protein Pcac1_g16891 [Phytophthora cactorum]KAG2866242.1 hypothetical protein PC113_g3012 [Phytophthora cactorum]KAG3037646.1 hypothetical protein PC119_g3472 [Phytophthora cactorum]